MTSEPMRLTKEGTEEVLAELGVPPDDTPERRALFERIRHWGEWPKPGVYPTRHPLTGQMDCVNLLDGGRVERTEVYRPDEPKPYITMRSENSVPVVDFNWPQWGNRSLTPPKED
jgi:hypothetical protein